MPAIAAWWRSHRINNLDESTNSNSPVILAETNSGILDLIVGRGDWGAVEIIEPAVFFYTPEKSKPRRPKDSQPPGRSPESKSAKGKKTDIPALYGQFRVTNGSLHSVSADGNEKVIAKNLVFQSSLAGGSANGSLDAEGHHRLSCKADIKLVSKGDRWDDPLQHLNFSGALHVDSVKAYGLSLSPKDVPIRLVDASADAKLELPANFFVAGEALLA